MPLFKAGARFCCTTDQTDDGSYRHHRHQTTAWVHRGFVADGNVLALWGCSGYEATLWLGTDTTVFSLWICAMNFSLLRAKCTWESYESPKCAWGLDLLSAFERWPVSLLVFFLLGFFFSFPFSFEYLWQWAVGTMLNQQMFNSKYIYIYIQESHIYKNTFLCSFYFFWFL